jgi:hypothetical protein
MRNEERGKMERVRGSGMGTTSVNPCFTESVMNLFREQILYTRNVNATP